MKSQGRAQTLPPSRNSHAAQVSDQRYPRFRGEIHRRLAADRQSRSAQRRDVEAPPAAQVGRAAEEVPLEERHGGFQSWAQAIDRAASRTKGEHGARAQRHVGAALERDLVVVVVAAQPPARLLEVHRGDVALARIGQITGGIAACVEEDRGPQPLRYAAVNLTDARGIEAERNQLVPERQIGERLRRYHRALVLVRVGERTGSSRRSGSQSTQGLSRGRTSESP